MFHNWLLTRPGEVLVATETDKLCYIHITGGVRTEGLVLEGVMRNRILSISDSRDGKISAGTNGNGLFYFTGDTLLNFTTADGMLSNFCYSTLIASDGRVWTGHEKGFSIINPATGSARSFSSEFGFSGDCIANAMAETHDGSVYVGTTEGIWTYIPAMEHKVTTPPQAGILSVVIGNTEYPVPRILHPAAQGIIYCQDQLCRHFTARSVKCCLPDQAGKLR